LWASALALAAVGLGILPGLHGAVAREWAFAAVAALVGGFFVAQALSRRDTVSVRGDEKIDDLAPALGTMALMTIWTPVLLGAAAIVLLVCFDVDARKVSWAMVVIAGAVGQHLSNLKNLRSSR
jgi:uncharacterized membrane protein YbhN (UPF0104 family)